MKTIYRCDGCGQEFKEWKDCLGHEDAHIKIKSSQLVFNLRDRYPCAVEITFDDDSCGIYELSGITQEPPEKSPLLQTED